MVSSRPPLGAEGETARAPWWGVVDAAAILGFCALLFAHALDWFEAHRDLRGATLLLVSLPVGIALADFATGLVHWIGDTFFEEDTPLVGARWIHPFREHHRDPLAITRHGPLEVSGNNCLLLVGVLVTARSLGPGLQSALEALAWGIVLVFCAAVAISNQLHRWAHAPRCPGAVQWLQRRGLVLSPEAHDRHHDGRHDRAFCVTTGWCNTVLDRISFFARLERRVSRRRGNHQNARMSGR